MPRFFTGIGGLLAAVGLFTLATPAQALEPLMTHLTFSRVQEPDCLPFADQLCCGKDHVYIFAVNGLDPICLGNINGLLEYFQAQGFQHTYFGQLYTPNFFGSKIARIRQEDPEARIVLIGFSLGCEYVRSVANHLARQGVRIDLLVYLGGDLFRSSPRNVPDNVCRVLNIRAHGIILTGGDLFFNGVDMDGAMNYQLDVRHIKLPGCKEAVTLVTTEVLSLACTPGPALPPAGVPAPPAASPVP